MKPVIAVAVGLLASPAFAVDAVSALSGRWPFEVASSPEFRRLAGEAVAREVERLMETGPKSETVGGRWVVSEGCRPHACDTAAAFVAVDGKTGGVWAWTTTSGKGYVRVTGNPAAASTQPSPEVTAKLDGWRSRLSPGGR